MSKISVFDGINISREAALKCFNPVWQHFEKGQTVIDFSDSAFYRERLGILLNGRAYMYFMDIDGRSNLAEIYEENDIFGKIFLPDSGELQHIVVACEPCDIVYIDYHAAVNYCEKNCVHHAKIASNLFRIGVYKSEQLVFHTNVLSARSIRAKLTAYLLHESGGKSEFKIPLKLNELADYLCVDRSAMLREIKNMRDDGLIYSKGRYFELYGL